MFERRQDQVFFHFRNRSSDCRGGFARLERSTEIIDIERIDFVTFGHDECAMDRVFQFPHVAGPRMRVQPGECALTEHLAGFVLFVEFGNEKMSECFRIARAFA